MYKENNWHEDEEAKPKRIYCADFIITADVRFDLKFWAILPALNINLHSKNFEFEWLCLGIYITVNN